MSTKSIAGRLGSTAEAADSSDLSDRSEQSDVMMIDQHSPQLAPVESDGSQAAAAASDALGMPETVQSNSSQTPPLQEVSSPAAAGAVKPRVFKMSDEFLMFKFKIEMCSRKDRHDWKICPYAHPGEVARRRHPRGYTAVLCPAKTAASCPRREQCTFAHNPFEFWLHPDRFKTSLCNQGPNCDRPICFFAHKDEEVRRLAHGLEAAGPDDYVYATAATPEPHNSDAGSAHPPPPPPPPRMNSLGHAGSGALGYLQSSTIVAAAAAAAAAAASLNNSGLLLGASSAQHYQQMMMAGGNEGLLQAAGSGLLPDAANALCGSSWLNSNSDPLLMNSLTASGRQLSATSPVPMPQPYSSGSASGRAFCSSLPAAGMMGVPINQSAAMAAAAGLDPSMLAGMQGMPLSHQPSGSSVSLAGASGMAGKAAGLAGSAPAGYSMLGNDLAGSAYQQQLLQQLQMEQHHQQQQMSQQQLLQEQLALQQQLQALIQQQAMAAASASSSSLQQLVQQQKAQLQLQQMAAAQQQAAQQQQWHASMLVSQPLAASAPASQLLWQQQQQQLDASQMQPGSYGSSSSMTPPESTLASVLGGVGSRPTGVMSSTQQVACTAPPAYGMGQQQQQQQGMLKWSSSVLSKRGSGHAGNSSSQDAMQRQESLEASGGWDAAVVGLMGSSAGLTGAGAAAAGGAGMLPPAGSTGIEGSTTLNQLNGLLQMVHVSSTAAMAGPGGSAY